MVTGYDLVNLVQLYKIVPMCDIGAADRVHAREMVDSKVERLSPESVDELGGNFFKCAVDMQARFKSLALQQGLRLMSDNKTWVPGKKEFIPRDCWAKSIKALGRASSKLKQKIPESDFTLDMNPTNFTDFTKIH